MNTTPKKPSQTDLPDFANQKPNRDISGSGWTPPPMTEKGFSQPPKMDFDEVFGVTPDSPHWGSWAGVGFWVLSFVILFIVQLLFFGFYLVKSGLIGNLTGLDLEKMMTDDQNALFYMIVSTLPAHLLTLGAAWLLVTKAGKKPFLESLGWNWGKGLDAKKTFLLSLGVLAVIISVSALIGEPETGLMKIVKSSRAALWTVALMAALTAPLVEEVTYRGILYSPLQRSFGRGAAIAVVTALFALVHVPQYKESLAVIGVITFLSFVLTVVRAYSGNILPSVVLHTIINGVQALMLISSDLADKSN